MASYYVDITEDTGIGDGLSSVNYWGWNEFSARALSGILPDTDSYYMKGYRQFSEDLIFSAQNDGIYFYGWDGNAFIFDFTNTNQISFTGTMNNVIIQNMVSNAAAIRHNDRNFQMTIINSILLRDEGTLTVEGTYDPGDHGFDFCGCTIETNGILLDTDGQYEFENCLITSGTSISANEPNTHLQLRSCSLPGVANMAALTAGSPNDYTDIDDENNIYNAVLGSSLPTSADLQTLSGDGIRDNLNFTAFNVDSTLSGNSALWSMNTSYETTAYGNPTSGYIQGDVWQYNYSYGFKGTPRRGVGAFYFGGPYYIDLNATLPAIYEPSKANQYIYLSAYGTSADPFNYAQFFLSSQIYHGWEEWQFKGDISITSAVGGLFTFANDPNWRREFALLTGANVGEYIFNSWDLSANDLWRVNIVSGDYGIIYDGMTGTNVTIRDALISISGNDYGATAIMRTPSDANKNVTFYNSQIYVTLKGVPYLIVGSGENNRKYFYGSTIVLNDEGIADFQWGGSSFEDPVLICDCVLKADTSLNFNSNATSAYTITNIETNLSQVDLSGCTLSGNVYESTALTAIPDMIDDYDKNDFIYNNYAITVTATSAFTDYPTGIGALDRYGVGAFYFLPPPPQCFSADVSAGDVPLAVIFTTARGSGFTSATYMWDFGDGNVSSTTSASIAHTFTSAGVFTIQLTITGASADTVECSGTIIANATIGHIGAFYFGPVDVSSTFSANFMEIVAYAPSAIGEVPTSAEVPDNALFLIIRAYSPTVFTLNGLRIWFVGTPRKGTSPLCVDYEAFVEWHPAYADKYIITEYKWWFDYANFSAAEDGVVSECGGTPSSTISHIHQGQPGQTYDVRLCVQISPV